MKAWRLPSAEQPAVAPVPCQLVVLMDKTFVLNTFRTTFTSLLDLMIILVAMSLLSSLLYLLVFYLCIPTIYTMSTYYLL